LLQEEDKAKIQNDLRILTEKLNRLNESLQRKVQAKQEYEKTLQETEAAYNKVRQKKTTVVTSKNFWHCMFLQILESSQTLLHVLKRESANLTKKATGFEGM